VSNTLVVSRCISLQNISRVTRTRVQRSTGAASFIVLHHARDFIPHEFAEHAFHYLSGGSGSCRRNKSHFKSQKALHARRPPQPGAGEPCAAKATDTPEAPVARVAAEPACISIPTLESGCPGGWRSQLGRMKTAVKTPTLPQLPLSHPSHMHALPPSRLPPPRLPPPRLPPS
jgi:hypothetical protein